MAQGELPADFIQEQDGDIAIAPERFKSAGEIQDCCNNMLQADRRRVPWRTSINGLIDGNPAYSLQSLKNKGQGWRARVNYREAEGVIQNRQQPFYDLVSESDPCVEICLDYGKGSDQSDWENTIAKRVHWLLMRLWRKGFNYHVPLAQREMLVHGLGCHIWPGKPSKWIPRTPRAGAVLFPDGVSVNVEEDMDYFMYRDFMPGYMIYDFIRNEDRAAKLGWNIETVWQALAQSSKVQFRSGSVGRWNVEMAQREFKAGDIGTTQSRQSGLWLDTLLCREIETGKISQYAVAEGVNVNGKSSTSDDPFRNCLFRKRNKYDSYPLVLFPFDIGNGDIHSIRGLGARTKDFFELSNRIKNAMADQVLVGSTMNLKQTGNVDPDKLKLMRLGMMSIIPQGLDAVTGLQFPPLAQGPIALSQELERTMKNNNESYMQAVPDPLDRETAQSYSMRTQNSSQVAKGPHGLYASNYQQFLEFIVRRICRADAVQGESMDAKLAKRFQNACVEDGVPIEVIRSIANGRGEINEVFSSGAGSPAARIDGLLNIFKYIYPGTTTARQINIERDFVSAVTAGSKVDRYARSHDDNNLPDEDASLAVVENNGLMSGGDALVSSQQDHVEHLQRHEPKAQEVVQAVMQGQMDPEQGLAVIQKFGAHMADHLKFLQQNPMRKTEFDAFYKEWTALSVIADKLTQQIAASKAAQPKQPPQQQVSDELKIGLSKVAAGERVGLAKVASKGRIDLSKLRIDSQIKAAQVALDARNGAKDKIAA